jgi:hypothetical protein
MRCPGANVVLLEPDGLPVQCPVCERELKPNQGRIPSHGDHKPCPVCDGTSKSHHESDHAGFSNDCAWCRMCPACDAGIPGGGCYCGNCSCVMPGCRYQNCLPGYIVDAAERRAWMSAEAARTSRALGLTNKKKSRRNAPELSVVK